MRKVTNGIPASQNNNTSLQTFRQEINAYHFDSLSAADEDAVLPTDMHWENELAMQRVEELRQRFGEPDAIDKRRGGFARWIQPPALGTEGATSDGNPCCYEFIMVEDVGYFHHSHLDFLFVGIHMPLKKETQKQVLDLTGSAYYYAVGEILVAGCHFLGASIGTFSVVKDLNEGLITIPEAQKRYSQRIGDLHEEKKNINAADYPPLLSIYERYIFGL